MPPIFCPEPGCGYRTIRQEELVRHRRRKHRLSIKLTFPERGQRDEVPYHAGDEVPYHAGDEVPYQAGAGGVTYHAGGLEAVGHGPAGAELRSLAAPSPAARGRAGCDGVGTALQMSPCRGQARALRPRCRWHRWLCLRLRFPVCRSLVAAPSRSPRPWRQTQASVTRMWRGSRTG